MDTLVRVARVHRIGGRPARTSITTVPVGGHARPTFQQAEIVRPLFSIGRMSLAARGGIRQDWDGTRVLLGRVLGRTNIGNGRLLGSVLLERVTASTAAHDRADVITTIG
jgi:hypothetical protein